MDSRQGELMLSDSNLSNTRARLVDHNHPQGKDPEKVPGILTFTKMIQPVSGESGDTLIEPQLLATPAHSTSFTDTHIRKNTVIFRPCDMTYSAKDIDIGSVSHLGMFFGSI